MSTTEHKDGQPLAALVDLGRRLVAASADLPREALRFLGTPTLTRRRRPPSGAAPGHMVMPHGAPKPLIRVMAYGADRLEEYGDVTPARLRELADQARDTLWIDVEGFGDREVLAQIGEALGIHALAMADVVHVPQRPKAELYDGRLLLVAQMARFSEAGEVLVEQISLVLGPGWVISFQEQPGDVFDPLRERLRSGATRIR